MRFSLLCLLILACAVTMPMAQEAKAQAQKSFSLLNVLPERTLSLLGTPHFGKVKQAFRKTNIYRLATTKEMKLFFEPIIDMIRPKAKQVLKKFEAQFGLPLVELLAIPSGEIMVAVIDVDPSNRMMPFDAVATFQVDGHMKQMMHVLNIVQRFSGMKFVKSDFQGIPVYSIPGAPIVYAIVNETFVVTSKQKVLEELLNAHLKGVDEKKLFINNPHVKKIKEIMIPSDEVCAFGYHLNVKGIFAIADKLGVVPPFANKIMEDIGVRDIHSICITSNVAGRDLHSQLYMYAPGKKRGIHKLYAFPKANIQKAANKFPFSLTVFSAGNFDLGKFINDFEEILKLVDPMGQMGLMQNFQQGLAFIEQKIGLNIKTDIAAAFGSQSCSGSFFLPGGGLFPEGIQIVKIKDKAKAQKCIDTFSKLIGVKVNSTQYRGKKINYFLAPLGRLGENPFRSMERARHPLQAIRQALSYSLSGLAFTMIDNKLYMAQSAQGLMAYLDWKWSYKPAFSGNRMFLKKIEKADPHSFAFIYFDPAHGIKKWWNTGRFLMRTFEGYIRGAGIPMESARLPRAGTLAKYMTPSIWTISGEKDGLLLSSRGSLDVLVIGAATTGIVAAIAIPAFIRAKESAQNSVSLNNLRQIGKVILLYRTEHGKYPAGNFLQEFAKKGMINASTLYHPADKRSSMRGRYSYECSKLPLELHEKNSKLPIVWERYGFNRRGHRNALYIDGHVDRISPYRFYRIMNDIERQIRNYQRQQEEQVKKEK